MELKDFQPYWNTPSDVIVINDAARYFTEQRYKESVSDEYKRELKRWCKILHADYDRKKITPLKHGNNRATYIKDLEQYIPTEENIKEGGYSENSIAEKIKAYLLVYDDGQINAKDVVEAIRKYV